MKEFHVKSQQHSRFYQASSPEVAAKRFLNYLRRFTNERPTTLEIWEMEASRLKPFANVVVEWYKGRLVGSPAFSGAEGEWYRLKSVTRRKS